MPWVAIAAPSRPAAEAAKEIADRGGNAVDAAVAACLVAMTMDLGIVSPAAGGFLTIWPEDQAPVVIDANNEMPGRATQGDPAAAKPIWMSYGGGMETVVGWGSVATPGAIAGLERAVQRYGALQWESVVEPARVIAEEGFPLRLVSRRYFEHSGTAVFGWHAASRRLLFREDGTLRQTGEVIVLPRLAEAFARLARQGARDFYEGETARAIAAAVTGGGGKLSEEDLAAYRPIERRPIRVALDSWTVATNPPPAMGGATLAAMLVGLTADEPDLWVETQAAVLGYRRHRLNGIVDNGPLVERLLEAAADHRIIELPQSPSTIHVSAVDESGLACALTMSAGYGCGALVEEVGIYLNNSLGEIELGPAGFQGWSPGDRLPSNMAPTVARREDGAVFAIGSPGADRITTAIAQVVRAIVEGAALETAIARPRIHVEDPDGPIVTAEPGIRFERPWSVRWFDEPDMFFGGVQAAGRSARGEPLASADPRRHGSVAIGGQ